MKEILLIVVSITAVLILKRTFKKEQIKKKEKKEQTEKEQIGFSNSIYKDEADSPNPQLNRFIKWIRSFDNWDWHDKYDFHGLTKHYTCPGRKVIQDKFTDRNVFTEAFAIAELNLRHFDNIGYKNKELPQGQYSITLQNNRIVINGDIKSNTVVTTISNAIYNLKIYFGMDRSSCEEDYLKIIFKETNEHMPFYLYIRASNCVTFHEIVYNYYLPKKEPKSWQQKRKEKEELFNEIRNFTKNLEHQKNSRN